MKKLIATALVSAGVIAGGNHLYQNAPVDVNLPDLSGEGITSIEVPRKFASLGDGMVFSDIIYTNYPGYTNGQYYVWESTHEAVAQAALDYINTSPFFPVVGSDTAGNKQPNKQKTLIWAEEIKERSDGSFCFERVPEASMEYMGVHTSNCVIFLDTFQPSIEEYQPDWFNNEGVE